MSTTTPLIDVQVDALSAQGHGNLALRLVPVANASPLPAFEAGAHIDLHLPGDLVRQYSICSAPQQRGAYSLCIRRDSASRGGSRYVHERLRVGDTLRIGRPRNLFKLQHAPRSILLAGGIGITPLLSMAQALEHAQQAFELHYYVRQRQDAAFARQWLKGFQHGQLQLHCSAEGQSLRAQWPSSLAQADRTTHIYACGPSGMMAHAQQQAMALGWDAAQWHQEAFAPAPTTVSASANTCMPAADTAFEVELESTGAVYWVSAEQSIATALQNHGVAVPLSCEMGICGACLTPVRAGTPDHRDSVQSAAEKAADAQHITLCCSRSHSQRLVLAL